MSWEEYLKEDVSYEMIVMDLRAPDTINNFQ